MSFRAKLRLQFFTHIWYFLISIPHSDRQIEIPMIPLVVALQASFICTNISCSAFSSSPSAYNGFLLHFFLPFLSLESKLFFTGDSSAWDISCFRNTSWLLTKWKFSVSYKCFRGKKKCILMLKILDCIWIWPDLKCIWVILSLWWHHSLLHAHNMVFFLQRNSSQN